MAIFVLPFTIAAPFLWFAGTFAAEKSFPQIRTCTRMKPAFCAWLGWTQNDICPCKASTCLPCFSMRWLRAAGLGAQDEALARIAAQPELLPAGRGFVEEFIDTHPLALQPKFSDQMREHERGDLLRRLSVRLPDEFIDSLEAKDTGKLKNSFALLAKQPAANRAIVFDQLMTAFAEASNRRPLHPLPVVLANVNGAGPVFISMLERRQDWPAADRAALAYAACTANLDPSGWARLEAILRADLQAGAERIADADITVSISGLANAGLGQVEIAELMEQHLGPLDTVPLMPSNVRPVSAAKETSLLRLNLAWIAHLAKGDCENRLG